jgi:hypothetical protein
METWALLQKGKRNPEPLIFIDAPGGTYWKRFFDVHNNQLLKSGVPQRFGFRFDSNHRRY